MARPLDSIPTAPSRDFTATTSRSAGVPGIGTRSLAVQPLGTLPLATRGTKVPLKLADSIRARLPTFHARAADQTHGAFMPDAARPVNGTPAGLIPRPQDIASVLTST